MSGGCYGCGGPVESFGGFVQPAVIDPFRGLCFKRIARWWTKCLKCGVVTEPREGVA